MVVYHITIVYYKNYVDTENCIQGICLVTRKDGAHPHHHPVDEVYELVYGQGVMRIGNTTQVVNAPYTVRIPEGIVHTISAISPFIILKYYFPRGPFASIPYTWIREPGKIDNKNMLSRAKL